ncbi:MAG: hypothetical protein RBR44_01695 [Bacilli bacterium]|nr:hypothetical protein [Bacilli bacterium]
MKKKFLLLPLLMLVLGACVPKGDSSSGTVDDSSSDPSSEVSSDPSSDTSSDSSTDPSEKEEIDPSGLNAILKFDVYSLLPEIYSNDYEVGDYSSESYPIDVYIDLFDWELNDVIAYETALESSLVLDEDNGYIIQENLYIFIYEDTENFDVPVFGLNIYSIAESVEKDEINPALLNTYFDFDIYVMIPQIFSNDYEIGSYPSEDYPVDVYIDLYDWTLDDVIAYDDALYLSLDVDENYGYVIQENLFIFVNIDENTNVPFINIYSDAAFVAPEVSALWPADAINSFFGSPDIGALVPAFVSAADFSYYVSGEDDMAQLIIYTDYATVDGEDLYVSALETAGWVVDDTSYDTLGYIANDADEQIYLIFYWYEGAMYWSFMAFYHEPEPEPADGTALFDFSTADQRLSLSSDQQVWLSDDHVVTLTINKSSAASGIVDYTNPLRVYSGHEVIYSIEEGYVFDSIIITANSTSHADVVGNSIITGGSVLVEGSVVTITADAAAEVISFTASAQTRWNSVEVYYSEVL